MKYIVFHIPSMITCVIMGGLGNQLFEIFAMLGYAFKNKDSVVFTYTPMADAKRHTYWETFLAGLKPFTTLNPKYNVSNEQLNSIRPLDWSQHHYIELPQCPKNRIIRIFGYFQSYKYFDEYRDTLFRMIRLDTFQKQMKSEYSHYFDDDAYTISMHFRYGDYKSLQKYHNLLPESYYRNALAYMVSVIREVPKLRVLYFCEKEDNQAVGECIRRFTREYPTIEFMKVDDSIVDWKQMVIMSCCNSHIIANSTYSWWGAYFNTSTTKHVCYPYPWFGPENAKNKLDDMFLPSWTKITGDP